VSVVSEPAGRDKGDRLTVETPINILTFIMVLLHTGTNFPAVSVNSLFTAAMMKTRQRWNGTGVPTQSHPHAASLIISAWNNSKTWTAFLGIKIR
jgi:hypothetical protein